MKHIDWGAVMIIAFIIFAIGGGIIASMNNSSYQTRLIETCITNGGEPVITNKELKECKREKN